MTPALNSYLHQHQSLSIPGIGTIYIERTPARSDFTNRQILPPGYHYRFDRYFDTPDRQFFSFVAKTSNIADYEAMRWYNEWAMEMSAKLKSENLIFWDGIGTITKTESGDVRFETIAPIDACLSPVPANRIIRSNISHTMLVGDKEVTNLQMSGYLNETVKQTRSKPNWPVYAIVIGSVLIIALFLYLYNR